MSGKFRDRNFLRYPETMGLYYDLFSSQSKGWKPKEIKGFSAFLGRNIWCIKLHLSISAEILMGIVYN